MIYKREEFVQDDPKDTDFPVKQVDRLSSVDGKDARYIGRAALALQTPYGIEQIPVSFEIQAKSVEEAFAKFRQHAEPKFSEVKEHIEERLEQLRRAEESRIITPAEAGPAGGIIHLDDLKGR